MTLKKPERESQNWSMKQVLEGTKKERANFSIGKMVLDDFPYPHTDVWVYSQQFKDKLVFGVPRNHEQGMAFYTLTEKGAYKADTRPEYEGENPECPFHEKATIPTKQFDFSDTKRIQFKCPECYLTRYVDGETIE